MTLLMTAGEFDLSVGSVFGFAPVLMWTLFNSGTTSLERRLPRRARSSPLGIGLVNGLFVTRLKIPSFLVTLGMLLVVRGTALFITDGFPQRTWSAEGQLARRPPRRRLLHRPVPHLHVAVLVHRRRDRPRLCADAAPRFGNWIQAAGGNAGAARARGVNVNRVKIVALHADGRHGGLRRRHQLDPHLGRQPQQRHRLRARGHRHGGDRRHGADRRPRHHHRHRARHPHPAA